MLELIKVTGINDDLELVDFQKEKIQKVLNDVQVINREFAAQIGKTPPQEQSQLIKSFKEKIAKAEEELASILLPAQLERLRQIRMNLVARNDGATFGLKNREFLELLDLTPEQKAKVAAKAAELSKLVEEKVKKLQAEIEKVKLEAREEVFQVLTPEQRKKYLDLVGRPFEGDR
ncbi:MAG: hypothetical protein ACKVP0_11810 [Pirellulaceae bacterium]